MTVVDIVLPDASAEGTTSVVGRWFVAVGQAVSRNQPLLEIDTDKTTIEIAAPADGVLSEILKATDEAVTSHDLLGRITVAAGTAASPTATAPAVSSAEPRADDEAAELTPAVRRLLKEHGLDPGAIRGTGRNGRVTAADIERHLHEQAADSGRAQELSSSRLVPLGAMQRAIAAHMVKSALQLAPHVTAVYEVDLARVVEHRERHLDAFGVRLTYSAYFVFAAARALIAVPEVNSRWHEDALELFSDANIGVVTAIEHGLLVPVVRRAQSLELGAIATTLHELTDKARQGRLNAHDTRGSTFAITNHGMGGSLIATPIIHQPHAAILGVGKLQKRAKVVEEPGGDAVRIRPMIYATLTIDHRVLDAARANAFMARFAAVLENWGAP